MTVRARVLARLRDLRTDLRGATIIEFAFVAPALVAMMLGVFDIGMSMQKYNAMRNIAADVGRYAVVNYQTNNRLTTDQLSSYTRSIAISSPYFLDNEDLATATVAMAGTQRVADVVEYRLTLTYRVDTLLKFVGVPDFDITYQRPIFVAAAS